MQSVFKSSDVLFALRQTPILATSGHIDIFVRFWVRLTFGQMYHPDQPLGQVDIFVRLFDKSNFNTDCMGTLSLFSILDLTD